MATFEDLLSGTFGSPPSVVPATPDILKIPSDDEEVYDIPVDVMKEDPYDLRPDLDLDVVKSLLEPVAEDPSQVTTLADLIRPPVGVEEGKNLELAGVNPDSFGSRVSKSFNESYKSILDFVGVGGRLIGGDIGKGIEDWSESQILEADEDIRNLGTPTRVSSFTKGLGEIGDEYEEEGLFSALGRGAFLVQDMVADVLGSVALPIGGVLAAVPIAALAGTTAAAWTATVTPFLIGGFMGGGAVEEEAKKLGATQAEADQAALLAAPIIGLLERIGVSRLITHFVKNYGKEAVIRSQAKKLGREDAEKGVNRALDFGKRLAKAETTRMGLRESSTEALQEVVQMGAAGLAADKGLLPYGLAEGATRVIDAGALGLLGGVLFGGGTQFVSNITMRQANQRAKEIKEELKRAKKTLSDVQKDLYKPLSEGRSGNPGKFSNVIRRSTTPLLDFANRDPRANNIVSKLNTFFDDSSAAIGKYGRITEKAYKNMKRELKLPLMRDIPKKKMDELYNVMTHKNFISESEDINRAAEILRQDVFGTKTTPEMKAAGERGTGLYADMQEAGMDLGFRENYLPRVWKLGIGGKKLSKSFPTRLAKFRKIMKEGKVKDVEIEETIDNIIDNDGMYVPETETIRLRNPHETGAVKAVSTPKASLQFQRTFTNPKLIKKFEDAGLIEKNVRQITNRYIMHVARLKAAKDIETYFNKHVNDLIKEKKLTNPEASHLQDVFGSLINSFNPLRSSQWKALNKYMLSYQYMATLPLSAITSLTEPLFVLSRVKPSDALFGGVSAILQTLKKGVRSILPKSENRFVAKDRLEQDFNSILQGFDASMAERFSDISGMKIPKRFSDRFFKTILLTQVTQLSRNMAFQAMRRSLKTDILEVLTSTGKIPTEQKKWWVDPETAQTRLLERVGIRERAKGKPKKIKQETKSSLQAQRRLLEIGLIDPNQKEIIDWVNDRTEMPEIISKAMSRMVDEIIMAPNAVNRPLWMNDPRFALIAQLKGFTMALGNTLGYRMYTKLLKPLWITAKTGGKRGELPLEEAIRYSLMWSLMVVGTMGTKALKEFIRYNLLGDSEREGPWEQLPEKEKIVQALVDSNIFGPGTIGYDALRSESFGRSFLDSVLGPTASWVGMIGGSVVDFIRGKPKPLSKAVIKAIPILNQVRGEVRKDMERDVHGRVADYSRDVKNLLSLD